MPLKLISDQVEEYIPESQQDDPNPTVFGLVRLGKGRVDALNQYLERGEQRKGGKKWESYRTKRLQHEIWKAGVKWIRNIRMADGALRELVDDPAEIAALYESFPAEPAYEVVAVIQGISQLDEDEQGNSRSGRGSSRSETRSPTDGPTSSADTAEPTT